MYWIQITTQTINKFHDREKVTSLSHDTSKDPEWRMFFENMHLFSNYFVENNADVVIQKYEKAMAKRTTLLQKQKHHKRKSQFSKQKSMVSSLLKKKRDQISLKGINEKYELHEDPKALKSRI